MQGLITTGIRNVSQLTQSRVFSYTHYSTYLKDMQYRSASFSLHRLLVYMVFITISILRLPLKNTRILPVINIRRTR